MAKISVFLNASLSRVDVKFLIDENAAYRKPSKKKKKKKRHEHGCFPNQEIAVIGDIIC